MKYVKKDESTKNRLKKRQGEVSGELERVSVGKLGRENGKGV